MRCVNWPSFHLRSKAKWDILSHRIARKRSGAECSPPWRCWRNYRDCDSARVRPTLVLIFGSVHTRVRKTWRSDFPTIRACRKFPQSVPAIRLRPRVCRHFRFPKVKQFFFWSRYNVQAQGHFQQLVHWNQPRGCFPTARWWRLSEMASLEFLWT